MPRPLPALAALCLCLGCAPFPALDDRITDQAAAAPYPVLTPLDPLLADAARQQGAPAPDDLAARIAALEARAAALRGAVVDRATAERFAEGVADAPLR